MSGIRRQISGELAKVKSKGKTFVSAMASALSPSSISKEKPKTQPTKGKKKSK